MGYGEGVNGIEILRKRSRWNGGKSRGRWWWPNLSLCPWGRCWARLSGVDRCGTVDNGSIAGGPESSYMERFDAEGNAII